MWIYIREFLISQGESITDLMDSMVLRLSKAERRKRVLERMRARELRGRRDEHRRQERLRRERSVKRTAEQGGAGAPPSLPSIVSRNLFANRVAAIRCSHCGGECTKVSKNQDGCGCLLVLIGLLAVITFVFLPVGIFLIFCGLLVIVLMRGRYWACRSCGSLVPRR